jgi:hypothetical protein
MCNPPPAVKYTFQSQAVKDGTRSADARPSPRDWRRTWAAFLPRPRAWRHPRARFLAAWAEAILYQETYTAWLARHPEECPPELRAAR